ncbi:MAG: hypothetical protein PVG24_07435 [Gammaproteobacteria bacterium]|jgi:hypothetical protein
MRLIIGTTGSPANPLLRAVSLLIAAVAFVAALVLGAVFLAFVIGFVLILAVIITVRMWWLGRKLRKAGVDPRIDGVYINTHFDSAQGDSRVIEGECTDVSEDSSERQR